MWRQRRVQGWIVMTPLNYLSKLEHCQWIQLQTCCLTRPQLNSLRDSLKPGPEKKNKKKKKRLHMISNYNVRAIAPSGGTVIFPNRFCRRPCPSPGEFKGGEMGPEYPSKEGRQAQFRSPDGGSFAWIEGPRVVAGGITLRTLRQGPL